MENHAKNIINPISGWLTADLNIIDGFWFKQKNSADRINFLCVPFANRNFVFQISEFKVPCIIIPKNSIFIMNRDGSKQLPFEPIIKNITIEEAETLCFENEVYYIPIKAEKTS